MVENYFAYGSCVDQFARSEYRLPAFLYIRLIGVKLPKVAFKTATTQAWYSQGCIKRSLTDMLNTGWPFNTDLTNVRVNIK